MHARSALRRATHLVIACWVAAALVLAPRRADAHDVGLSRGDYELAAGVLTVHATFLQGELRGLMNGLDGDDDGTVTAAELAHARPHVGEVVAPGIVVHAGGAECPGTLDDARLDENDGIALLMRYRCPGEPREVDVDFALIDNLAADHRHLARILGPGAPTDILLSKENRTFRVVEGAASRSSAHGVLSFFTMGVEHILHGYDHLVFLLGLVLVGGRPRSVLVVVTAFTVAHSITLALAVLGVWTPSPRLVEPAIALSIAYVGVENFFVHDVAKRWRITFPFGMIHGFGFAGALREAALSHADVPAALVLFNLGVEAGQILVLAVLLPALFVLRKASWFRTRGVQVISAAIVVAGLAWFVARIE
jgi:hydrogenase/urease accessory protein HupE